MAVLVGTDAGVFRAGEIPFDEEGPELVLDRGAVMDLRTFDHAPGAFAAAESGLYRSTDGGRTWEDLDVPAGESEVWSVLATSEETLYAGTNDPFLYRSLDGGETWAELTGFRELPSRGFWESPVDPTRARLRTLDSPPGRPEWLVAGIESGGVHVSDDGGQTWMDRRGTITDDIHHVEALSPDVYYAATGYLDLHVEHVGHGHGFGLGGVHRTLDAGESWTRLDVGNDFAYVREFLLDDGDLYFGGAEPPPPAWRRTGLEAALFESPNLGRTMERASYPGEDLELIEAWAVADGRVLAGTGRYDDGDGPGELGGRLIARDGGEYRSVGRLPSRVTALTSV